MLEEILIPCSCYVWRLHEISCETEEWTDPSGVFSAKPAFLKRVDRRRVGKTKCEDVDEEMAGETWGTNRPTTGWSLYLSVNCEIRGQPFCNGAWYSSHFGSPDWCWSFLILSWDWTTQSHDFCVWGSQAFYNHPTCWYTVAPQSSPCLWAV